MDNGKPPQHPGRTPVMQLDVSLNKYSFNRDMKYDDFWLANKSLRPRPTRQIYNQLMARPAGGNRQRKTRRRKTRSRR
jgi:hypothetical protein